MPLRQDAVELLRARGFDQHDPAVNDDTVDDFFIVIEREDKRFWISCQDNLEGVKQIVTEKYKEQILPITLNELQQWP